MRELLARHDDDAVLAVEVYVHRLAHLGVRIDAQRNADAEPDADNSAPDAAGHTLVIASREALETAAGAERVLAAMSSGTARVRRG